MTTEEGAGALGEPAKSVENAREWVEEVAGMRKLIVIRGENAREFTRFAWGLLAALSPQNKMQLLLAEKIIFSAWRRRRAGALERRFVSEQNSVDAQIRDVEMALGKKKIHRIRTLRGVDLRDERIQQLIQYQFDLEKSEDKALRRLREEQGLAGIKSEGLANDE